LQAFKLNKFMSQPTSLNSTSVDSPFINSLGMPFVPVPRFSTLVCIWPTRVRDFETYASEKGVALPDQCSGSGPEHPIVSVTWKEAADFCEWLTEKERAAGRLPEGVVFRLPGDLEWSAAVGLPHEEGTRPDLRSGELDGYPWGASWPPPKGAGNYSQELGVDEYEFTSPVGSFASNEFGIYDLGGNVWEWCQDFTDRSQDSRVLRGASWFNGYQDRMKSSFRNDLGRPDTRYSSFGFRVVLGAPLKH
jgi:formylglycine-generating enzyme required for sulfatase activity